MRYILAMLLLSALLAPTFASVQVTVHDPRYHLSAPGAPTDPAYDWVRGVIFVSDQGTAPSTLMGPRTLLVARQAALTAAKARLAAHLGEMKLTSFATLGEAITTKLLPDATLDIVCAQASPVVEKYDPATRTCILTCVLPITGPDSLSNVAAQMLAIQQSPKGKDTRPTYADKDYTLRPTAPPTQLSSGPYTGLVLDCRGLKYTPVLTPKLIGQKGNAVWGTAGLNLALVKEKGVAAYAPDLRAALQNGRAGNTPLIIRPLGTAGPLRGDLVLRAEDITALQDAHAAETFLSTLSIVILID